MSILISLWSAIYALVVTALIPSAYGIEPSDLVVQSVVSEPYPDVMKQWVESFSAHELWRFEDANDLDLLLSSLRDPGLVRRIRKAAHRFPSYTEVKAVDVNRVLYPLEKNGIYAQVVVVIDANLRARIPTSFIKKIYEYERDRFITLKAWSRVETWREVDILLDRAGLSRDQATKVKQTVVRKEGKLVVPIAPDTWTWFSLPARKEWIREILRFETPYNSGVRILLTVRQGQDLASLARELAGERDAAPIERLLRLKLGNSSQVQFPLVDLLHSFIRKNLMSFQPCNGPNCFNAGFSVNQVETRIRFTPVADLLNLIAKNYRVVSPKEELRTGDLLVYADLSGRMVHVSTYLTESYAFTKNGLQNLSSYAIQSHEQIERIYFPDDHFQMYAYRIPGPDETVLDPLAQGWRSSFGLPYFRGRPLRGLGLTAQTSFTRATPAGNRILQTLERQVVGLSDLLYLLHQPNLEGIRPVLERAIQKYEPYFGVEPMLLRYGFNPVGSLNSKRAALLRIFRDGTAVQTNEGRTFLALIRREEGSEIGALIRYLEESFGHASSLFCDGKMSTTQ